MKVTLNRAAATREHLVRRLHMSGERPDTICALYTCTLTPAHVHDARSRAGVHLTHNLQYFRAQITTARSSSSLSSCEPTSPCSAVWAASTLAADASPTDTTARVCSRRSKAVKGGLAAGSSAQCGELRRSRERHPRQGCRGRVRCGGAGSPRPWASLRAARAQGSPRSLRILA